jgi:DNA-binding response OmpR family regulator
MSALVQEREQLAGYLSGADAYLIKPVSMTDLMQAIDDAIGLSEEERARRLNMLASDTSGG